jgi:hypothetical protein
MKTLELKHIAPYLPYELNAEILDCKIDYVGKQFDEIIGIHQWSKNGDWCLLTSGGSKPALNRVKPILRPLSQLTQDEKTCDEINLLLEPNGLEINNFLLLKNSLNAVAISWQEMQEVLNILYREHYDVFGLINDGLAIEKL